ncbi:MAG: hypothetical protein WA862_01770 [Solirubrobacterales bacterium]
MASDFARSKALLRSSTGAARHRPDDGPAEGTAGFGKDTEHGPKPFFWISSRGRAAVSAFVLDLDGNNIEAVCHRPPD